MRTRIDAYCVVGEDREYNLAAAALLRAMDVCAVDKAVISSPDRFLAVYNEEGNNATLRESVASGGRLIATCSVNPWCGKQAVDEALRSISEGARMLVLHPMVQGFSLSDELVYPVIDAAACERVPVYVHTGGYGTSTPWQLARLAQRYPDTDFIIGHCGATDFWNDVVPACQQAPNVYLESSLARPFNFLAHIKQAGIDKGIFGSFAPLNDFVFEWHQALSLMGEDQYPSVYGATLATLLSKRGAF
jgi:uncharacterized protein